jgi:hypothetical protein
VKGADRGGRRPSGFESRYGLVAGLRA